MAFYATLAADGDDGIWRDDLEVIMTSGLTLVAGKIGTVEYGSFILFPNVTIPNGALITSATIRFEAYRKSTSGSYNLEFAAAAEDNPLLPSSYSDALSRPLTTARHSFDNPLSWTQGATYYFDIPLLIEETVNRPGWASGNSFLLYWKATSNTPVGAYYEAFSAEGSQLYEEPRLAVEYSTAGASQNESGGSSDVVSVIAVGDGIADQSFVVSHSLVGSEVTLSWSPQVGASSYAIERNSEIIAWGVTNNTFVDSPGSGEHIYRVGVIQ